MKTVKLPGLIDHHVHLRDPGATHKEDFESGTKAAVAGGFVMVLDMPNNPEPTITRSALDKKTRLAHEKAVCDVGFIFGAGTRHPEFISGSTIGHEEKKILKQAIVLSDSERIQHDEVGNTSEFPKIIDDVYALKVYMDTTTGNLLIEDEHILENIFTKWPSHKPIVVHAEDETMKKAIGLAKKFSKKLHVAHLSQKSELERVIEEKQKGFPITCEVTPHHLFLTEKDAVVLGPYGIMKPPLKSRKDVDFLWKHIDAIDCIATDHAPHTKEEKESDKPLYGVPGLETSLPLMLTAVHDGRITIEDVIRLMHTRPREIFGISIDVDSYAEVELNSEYQILNTDLFTKCGWSPFDGMNVKGRVIKTVIRGKDVYKYA